MSDDEKPKAKAAKRKGGKPKGPPVVREPAEGWHPPKPLGSDKNAFYIFSPQDCSVREFRKSERHVRDGLLSMVRKEYFWYSYPGGTAANPRPEYDRAVSDLMAECRAKWFNKKSIRSRGVALDGSRVVAHFGDFLYVITGKKWERRDIRAQADLQNVYERDMPIDLPAFDPAAHGFLTGAEFVEFAEALRLLNWNSPHAPQYLAGWLAMAIIGGAMRWRPHLWISGAYQSGKTFAMDEIISKAFGGEGFAVIVQGNTSEAGLRQELSGGASIPVVFDEAEVDDKDGSLIKGVVEMARYATSGSGKITKAKSGGDGKKVYIVRSCFCFASIKTGLIKSADISRFAQLTIGAKNKSAAEFNQMKARLNEMLDDPQWVARFQATAIAAAQTISAAESVFVDIIFERTKDKRTADRMAGIMAAYFVLSGQAAGSESAFLDGFDLSDTDIFGTVAGDDDEVLRRLFLKQVRKQEGGEAQLWQMIKQSDTHKETLEAYGISVTARHVFVRADNPNVQDQIFRGTDWYWQWYKLLSTHPQALSKNSPRRIGKSSTRKYTALPLTYLEDVLNKGDLADANDGGIYDGDDHAPPDEPEDLSRF